MTNLRLSPTELIIGPGHPLGLNLDHIEELVWRLRFDDRALEVTRVAGTPYYRIINGRHRYVAALVRGDQWLECEVK